MLEAAMAFLASEYERVRLLKRSERSEVWLVSDGAGRARVLKTIHAGHLPYALLKAHPSPLWPEIVFCAEDADETVVVEEYVSGHTLEERRRARNWLTEAEAALLLASLAVGLADLHALGIVHRDIKPSNIIIESTGQARLIDFDAARVMKPGASHDTHRLGTEGYAPPEQFGAGATDGRSDLYARGVTVRECLGPAYHGRLDRILAKCTEKDPDRRYRDAEALGHAVRHLGRRRALRITAGLAAAVVLTAGLGLAAFVASVNDPVEEVEQQVEKAKTAVTDEARQAKRAISGKKKAPSEDGAKRTERMENDGTNSASGGMPSANPATGTASPTSSDRLESVLTFNGTPWEPADTIVLSSDDWRRWQRAANGETNGDYALFFPSGWQAALTLTNESGTPIVGARLTAAYDGGSHTETETHPVGTIAPGASVTVPIALGGRRIDSANAQQAYLSLHLDHGASSVAGTCDWNLAFYLRNDGGYRVFQEIGK